MAEKDDKGLIGFDPLAWMDDTEENEEDTEGKQEAIIEQSEGMVDEAQDKVTNEGSLTLDATLNIQNVAHLYEQLLGMLENQDIIEIDASEVASIDTSTLQLLVVLKQETIKLQKEMVIDFPSDNFIEAAELLGLAEMLNVDQAASGFF